MASQATRKTINRFDLKPHPFDGWFSPIVVRKEGPARFHYMVQAGEYASWHKISGRLILTHIDGAPLTLTISADGKRMSNRVLGGGEGASEMIEPRFWRTWESLGDWSLLIASTEHSSEFTNWHLAPDNWYPH